MCSPENYISLKDAKPLVSIIIPCFNSGKYLSDAINSVITQNYDNWECILIDDHSIDNTVDIINKYKEHLPNKIKHFVNPGKGASSARNHGINVAVGKYIKFLDSDDAIYNINVLSEQIEHSLQNNLDIVYGNELYYQDAFVEENYKRMRGRELNERNIHSHFFTRFPITSNFLYKTTFKHRLKWNEELQSGQEFHFLFCCYLNGLKFGYQNNSTVKIRLHKSINRISNKSLKVYSNQTVSLIKVLSTEIYLRNFNNIKFLKSFNLWKLRWSYVALKARNFKAFKDIQKLLALPVELKIQDKETKILYRLNYMNPYLAFIYYEAFKKIGKKDLFN